MNLFQEIDYRHFLRRAIDERKQTDPKANFSTLASFMRIQRSYLSRIIGGIAEISSDQLFLACQYLGLTPEEQSYLGLLVEYTRSGLHERKERLLKEIHAIQNKHLETKAHLSAKTTPENIDFTDYYLDPLHQVVHASLLIERYSKDPSLLAKDLQLPPSLIVQALQKLEQLGVISRSGLKIKVLIPHLTLPKDSKIYKSWRDQIRLLSLARLRVVSEGVYNYAVIFSTSEEIRKKIQLEFLDFLKRAEKLVKDSNADDTYQMNFDLLPWTRT